jgi:uroporphyrinogen decarboxylase
MQLKGMQAIAERCNIGASLNMMDLSVEAEAFGAQIHFSDDEVPTVTKGLINSLDEAKNITVPSIGAGRTGIYIEGVKKACEEIKDIPVFCGVIGPYSLAVRLFDMTELMMGCFDSPEDVALLVGKTTEFLTEYIKAFKAVGADGVIIAEPAAGLLSPSLAEEFSTAFVKKIIDAVSDEDFIVCYHNCGNTAGDMIDSLCEMGADILHFGNAIDLKPVLEKADKDTVIMGNLDPVLFKTATPDVICAELDRIYESFSGYDNFMISSGCDIPADSLWENLDAYFKKVSELYA